MKTTFMATAVIVFLGLCARADETKNMAAAPPNSFYQGGMAGKFGAGIILGDPTGASLKYWFDDTMAIDGAIGWSSDDDTDLYLHSDILWHTFDAFKVSQGQLPLYFGVGGLVRFRDDNKDNEVGIRVPVGISYFFDKAPVEIFAEIAPAIDVTPDTHGEITGGIGVRFWF